RLDAPEFNGAVGGVWVGCTTLSRFQYPGKSGLDGCVLGRNTVPPSSDDSGVATTQEKTPPPPSSRALRPCTMATDVLFAATPMPVSVLRSAMVSTHTTADVPTSPRLPVPVLSAAAVDSLASVQPVRACNATPPAATPRRLASKSRLVASGRP